VFSETVSSYIYVEVFYELERFVFAGRLCSFPGERPKTLAYTRCGNYLEITKCETNLWKTSRF